MTRVIMIGDFGKDLDDEFALLLAAALERHGLIRLLAVVANLVPALERARLAKGTLKTLGYGHVPVGVGTPCAPGIQSQPHEVEVPYLADASELEPDGHALMVRILTEAPEKSVTLVLNSGFTDAAALMRSHPELVLRSVCHVCLMGGVRVENGRLVPEDAANNEFDRDAAMFLHDWLQDNGVPFTVVMREAAYVCQMVAWLPVMLAELGHPVGLQLARRLPIAVEGLWQAVHAPANSQARGRLPITRDRSWFVRTTTGKEDPGIGPDETVWPFVESFRLYDPMNLLAAVPELAVRFYDPEVFRINGVDHKVIGRTRGQTRVRNPNDLRGALAHYVREALEASL